jgi:hypothetical protein
VDGSSIPEDEQFVQIKFHLMRLGCLIIEKQDELHCLEFGIVYKMYNGRECIAKFGALAAVYISFATNALHL